MRPIDLWGIFSIVFVFYLFFPFSGILITHFYWGSFRRRILHLWQSQSLGYEHLSESECENDYRFIGVLDGIDENKVLCLRNEGLSVYVDSNKLDMFLLPEGEGLLHLEKISLKEALEMSDVMKVFAGGPVQYQNNRLVFCSQDTRKPIVLFYRGSQSLMFARAATAGHRVHPYMNKITPFAIGLGTFVLLYMVLRYSGHPSLVKSMRLAMSFAITPLHPLLPPGILTSFLYTTFSRKAHRLRLNAEENIETNTQALPSQAALLQYEKLNQRASQFQFMGMALAGIGITLNIYVYYVLSGYFF